MLSSFALARLSRAAIVAVCAGVVALGLAACGGGGKDADPALAVPSSAPFYAQVTLRPDGKLKADAEAGLKKILGTDDPSAQIEKLVKSTSGGADAVDYQKDIEPWLGSRAGFFLTSFSGTQPQGAAVLASKDNGKAKDFVDSQGKTKRSYNDVDYRLDKDGDAIGVVDDYVVSGTERGFRTVVDTLHGDGVKTISTDASYKKALDELGSGDALATAYVSTQGLIDSLARSGGLPPDTLATARQAIVKSGGSASAVKLGLNSQAAAFDTVTLGLPQSSTAGEGANGAATALKALPGDAWFGFGVATFGDVLRKALQQVTQAGGLAGSDINEQLSALQQALGLDLDKDLFSWMGDLGVFVGGTTIADIGGALVIQSKDPAASRRALTKIRRLVTSFTAGTKVTPLTGVQGADSGLEITPSGFPVPIVLAVGGDKFVAGVNKGAIESALQPSSTVADSASFKKAAAALAGVDPQFFIDFGPISRLVSGLDPGSNPTIEQIRQYLSRLGAAAAGAKREGTVERAKLIVTLNG
jgi:uncharacterized protein DUF3352